MTETATVPALVFEASEGIPVVARKSAPNPYAEAVQSLVGHKRTLTVTLPTLDEKTVKQAVALLTKAGQAATPAVSVRKRLVVSGKTTRVTFWTRPLIVHKPAEVAAA